MMASQIQYRSANDVYEGLRSKHAIVLPDFLIETPDMVIKKNITLYGHDGEEIPYKKAETVAFKPFSSGTGDFKSSNDSRASLEIKALGNKKPLEGWDIVTGVVINDHFVPVYSLLNPDEVTLRKILETK